MNESVRPSKHAKSGKDIVRQERAAKVFAQFARYGLDAYLVTHLPSIRYLTGFSGSNAYLLVAKNATTLITDPRYMEQAASETSGISIAIAERQSLAEHMGASGLVKKFAVIGFHEGHITVEDFNKAKTLFKPSKLAPTPDLIAPVRIVKSKNELVAIRASADICDKVFQQVAELVRPGVTEIDIAAEISYRLKKAGAESDSFEPLVTSGIRTSIVHGKPTNRSFRTGDLVLLDFGARKGGYCSDMTRMIGIGKVAPKLRKLYDTVAQAHKFAIDQIRDGVSAKRLDESVRLFFKQRSLEQNFAHALGHGVGLEVHELPRISPRSEDILTEGNVFTVEPGIYIKGTGGVRLEDTVMLTGSRAQFLTKTPRELLIV